MKKRGAPKKQGLLDGFVLIRRIEAVAAYQNARLGGMTDRAAKQFAINQVKLRFPDVKISKSEVERALAELQPNQKMKAGKEVFSCIIEGDSTVVKQEPIKYKSLRKPDKFIFGKSKKIS